MGKRFTYGSAAERSYLLALARGKFDLRLRNRCTFLSAQPQVPKPPNMWRI